MELRGWRWVGKGIWAVIGGPQGELMVRGMFGKLFRAFATVSWLVAAHSNAALCRPKP